MEKNPGLKEKGLKKPGIMDISRMTPPLIEGMLNRKTEGITSLSAEDDGWKVNVEVLERKAVPDTQDLLGTYELKLTGNGDLISYKRTMMRKRGDRVSEAQE